MIDRGTIWLAALEDLGRRCSVDTTLDAEYVKSRIASEGEAFLTSSLPLFGKDFELALEELAITKAMFNGYARRQRRISRSDNTDKLYLAGGLPQFLQKFTSIVFDDSYEITRDELNQLRKVVSRKNSSARFTADDAAGFSPVFIGDLLPPLARPTGGIDEEGLQKMADAIAAVRQLCLMFGKEKSVCSDSLVNKAVEEFVRTDEELMHPFSTEE